MWKIKNLKATVAITTHCNARCPQCHRNNDDGLDKIDSLPLIHWTLDDFKKAFPPNIVNQMLVFTFCPSLGDPVMNPHLEDICRYIVDCNPHTYINVSTNGSLRTEDWWFRFSSISRHLIVEFAVDGIDQEMHARYRRNTDLQKVLNHMEAFSQGYGKVQTMTVLFKHNQDYIEQIKELTEKYGSTKNKFVKSDRFDRTSISHYHDNNDGEDFYLEEATIEFVEPKLMKGDETPEDFYSDDMPRCGWGETNTIVVSHGGQVYPCCYTEYRLENYEKLYKSIIAPDNPWAYNYIHNREHFNVLNRPLDEILSDRKFGDLLRENWKLGSPKVCFQLCTKNGKRRLQGANIIAKS